MPQYKDFENKLDYHYDERYHRHRENNLKNLELNKEYNDYLLKAVENKAKHTRRKTVDYSTSEFILLYFPLAKKYMGLNDKNISHNRNANYNTISAYEEDDKLSKEEIGYPDSMFKDSNFCVFNA